MAFSQEAVRAFSTGQAPGTQSAVELGGMRPSVLLGSALWIQCLGCEVCAWFIAGPSLGRHLNF